MGRHTEPSDAEQEQPSPRVAELIETIQSALNELRKEVLGNA